MDAKKFAILVGAVVVTIFGIGLTISLKDPGDPHPLEATMIMGVVSILVAVGATTLFGIIIALKDRSYPWAFGIFISGVAFPANFFVAIFYMNQVRVKNRESALPDEGWYADPTGRHGLRYWHGNGWSEIVSNNGESSIDPIDSVKPPVLNDPAALPSSQ